MAEGNKPLKHGFHRIELNKTVWDVPVKYTNLLPVGAGAYGQVWWVWYSMRGSFIANLSQDQTFAIRLLGPNPKVGGL